MSHPVPSHERENELPEDEFDGLIRVASPSVAEDIEVLVESILMSPGDGTSLPNKLIRAAERVEAWLATYRDDI